MRVSANTTAAMATLVLVATASFALARCAPEGVVPLLDAATNDACATASSGAECTGGWCRIPAGCDVLGTPPDEFGHGPASKPLTQVTLTHAVWMMQFELVHAQVAGQGFPVPELVNEPLEGGWYSRMSPVDPWQFVNAQYNLAALRGGSIATGPVGLRSGGRGGGVPSWSRGGVRLVRTIFPNDDARPKLATGPVDPGLFADGGK